MESRRVRTVVGLGVAALLFLGLVVGRLLGGVVHDGPVTTCDDPLPWDAAATAVGERAAVAGPVAATAREPDVGGAPTFLNLGNPHPDPERFDVVIYRDVRERFEAAPAAALDGAVVCVEGHVRQRDGVPQIVLEAPERIERG